ncbi:MAG: hypothetical protein K0Q93_1565 [Nocardioidaceae bacterium]|jgi:hypothetical protein|nr:hypothetical protein [Nocardioidaceae bacterium]
MPDPNDLCRSLEADEVEALGPMPAGDGVSPTTDRGGRTSGHTAEIHFPGVLHQEPVAADDDPFPPPRSLTTED